MSFFFYVLSTVGIKEYDTDYIFERLIKISTVKKMYVKVVIELQSEKKLIYLVGLTWASSEEFRPEQWRVKRSDRQKGKPGKRKTNKGPKKFDELEAIIPH